ncbi:MAG: HAMP domain-containing histidine kinase [Planctomycetaceae bacterium]|nr:HAMP domain-containing histidine kinase [Planctomycetales bacterium]MCB9922108.1 HAMP domain-containing histidine kinase [Planctomycetaceae bacterium]
MFERRSLGWPITLGVVMIVLVVALTVGWVLLTVLERGGVFYWTLLAVGTTFLLLVLVGVIMYLALSVKAINLNRRQANFMDSVTHELKSPIASLKLYLQTLNRRALSREEQENFFRFMLEDVERLDHLINHILDAARLERKPTAGEEEDIELAAFLRQCADEVRLRHRAQENSVELDVEPTTVHTRRVDIDMIFRNVIDNAFKYGGSEPKVEITSGLSDDGMIVTEIIDNGPGIPFRFRQKIFRRFVRLGSELEREKPGTGLGLYIVNTLVRRMRGKVRVLDRPSGSGTVFEISLPSELVRPVENVGNVSK